MDEQDFGDFRIKKRIAQGGMANIFLANHAATGQRVVLKKLLPELQQNPEIIDLFLTEADLGRLLRHHNIVQVLDAGEESGEYYIVMEYVDGVTLETFRLKAESDGVRVPPHLVCKMAVDALRGLHCAHILENAQGTPFGLVHRDISPSNVFISRDGVTKLADFGVANLEAHGSANIQRHMHGRPHYMSPEHASQLSLDGRSDVYSVGLMIHELLTGKTLFLPEENEPLESQVRRVLQRSIPPLQKLAPDIPPPVARVLNKALRQKRWLRFASADEFANQLEHASMRAHLWATEQDVSDYVCRF
jgi:eukaryotic-like serine/threonine-protein kinase